MKKEKLKTLILKKSKWVCGDPPSNDIKGHYNGKGEPMLLNSDGFMCCLGQFCRQLNPKIRLRDLLNKGMPLNLSMPITDLNEKLPDSRYYINTKLSSRAQSINDDPNTTVYMKIKKLKSLFKKHGYKIVVK